MYITLSDGISSKSYGFYPSNVDSSDYHGSLAGLGYVSTQDSIRYPTPNESATFDISQSQYEAVRDWAETAAGTTTYLGTSGFGRYDLLNNSCIDFSWAALQEAGIAGNGFYNRDGALVPKWNSEFLRQSYFSWYRRREFNREFRNVDVDVNDFFTRGRTFVRRDPLVLDLDGDGIETIAATGSGTVLFDHDGNGNKEGTGWVKGDDGILAYDRNGNGLIDNGAELFGADTVLSSGQKAVDGFSALADLDANQDGVFDANDIDFNHVLVWRDLNQDGISQADELKTLSETGIVSINLNATSYQQNLGNGNIQTASASFTARYPKAVNRPVLLEGSI